MTANEEDDRAIVRYTLVEFQLESYIKSQFPQLTEPEIQKVINDSRWTMDEHNRIHIDVKLPPQEEVLVQFVKVIP